MPDVPPFDGDKIGSFTYRGGCWVCDDCHALRVDARDANGCGNCRVIAQRAEERRAAARGVLAMFENYDRAQSVSDAMQYADKFADALDHYIARSSQGWCR